MPLGAQHLPVIDCVCACVSHFMPPLVYKRSSPWVRRKPRVLGPSLHVDVGAMTPHDRH